MRPLFALPLLLAGCTGEMVADLYPGEKITMEGAVFLVEENNRTHVRLRNFETAPANQQRLRGSAMKAAEALTGCAATDIRQALGVNLYDVTLRCPEN